MGVLKDVRIQLTVDPRIQDIIDIHVVDIPETYGLLLSRESVSYTHLTLPTNREV